MATVESGIVASEVPAIVCEIPELCTGDRLTRADFERRYSAMRHVKKAELIEGVVHMPSPVSRKKHSILRASLLSGWETTSSQLPAPILATTAPSASIGKTSRSRTPCFASCRSAAANLGTTTITSAGASWNWVAEVAASSESYDLHDKLRAYQRNGVREYIVWRVRNAAIDWFVLREGRFEKLLPDVSGYLKSEVFPGLWLDPAAMTSGDPARVMAVLQQGIASSEHAAFVARLHGQGETSS